MKRHAGKYKNHDPKKVLEKLKSVPAFDDKKKMTTKPVRSDVKKKNITYLTVTTTLF
jgi:hypothetical protein